MSDDEEVEQLIRGLERLGVDPLRALARVVTRLRVPLELTDEDVRLVYVNPAWIGLVGCSGDQVVGRTPVEVGLRSDETSDDWYRQMYDTTVEEGEWAGTFMARACDGRSYPQQTSIVGLFGDDGAFAGALSARIDLSEARLDLVQSDSKGEHQVARWRFGPLLTHLPVAVFMSDWETGRVVLANEQARKLYGYTEEEFRQLVPRLLVDPEYWGRSHEFSAQLRRDGYGQMAPTLHRRKDGSGFWGVVSVTRVRRGTEDVMLSFIRDVTAELAARDEVERSRRLASVGQMASAIAHDINNPATVAELNLAQLAQSLRQETLERPDLAGIREMVDDAREAVGRIGAIVGNLQLFSRSQAPCIQAVDVGTLLQGAARQVEHLLLGRIELVRDDGGSLFVTADPELATRVLVNLLSNALKILGTQEGSQRVDVRSWRDGETVRIEVLDTGPGLDVPLEHLVAPFERRASYGGAGLGLWIASDLLSRMGGRLEAVNRPEGGACFAMVLPRASPADAPSAGTHEQASDLPVLPAGTRVLVIDDESSLLRVMERILAPHCTVVTEETAEGALERLEGGERFDAVLCDMMMPRVDGRAFFEAVATGFPAHVDRILLLTGGAIGEERGAFVESLGDRVLRKPVSERALLVALDSVCRSEPGVEGPNDPR